ncbi:MAG: DNA polymerase III subunit alpha [Planctomycetes bacterium]|nr:DNA polymerase III subunit alpha [Planctomycetota bacterium]
MSAEFVHLHLHSHYSILDGVCQVPPLIYRAKELGFKEMALTDHGAMYGAIEFYTKASKAGIKPIIGFEAYVAPGSRFEKNSHGIKDASYHLTLLAKNHAGYQNLSRLCAAGYTEGFYYRPRIDKEILRDHSKGIIALSGCLSGEVSRNLLNDRFDDAETAAREYREIFGEDNFFLEIMNNGLEEQLNIIPKMDDLSKKLGIPLVATSDVHYILPEHAKVQEVLLCINTGKKLEDEKRMKMTTDDFYLKSAEQMRLAFKGHEDACDRTLEIASRCNLEFDGDYKFGKFHLPTIQPPDGMNPVQYLESLCIDGLKVRYGDPLPQEVKERFEKEMHVITKMGFPSYFLLVWDLVNFARTNDIPVGPGRGSAAGSIVAYSLGITNLDPLRYDLLFERFLNEGSNEMPDIDLDFDKERRHEVVEHIIKRHGADHCAKIVTFGCLSAKSAVRDVGRVLGVPLHEVDVIAKMIPDMVKAKGDKNSLEVSMDENPDLKALYDSDPQVKELIDIAGLLDGVVRQTGIHAAGVLVADQPITAYGPLAKRGDDITTQYEMKMLETLGLCKVDCLGLETLTLLRKAVDNVKKSTGEELDLDKIPIDCQKTFRMLAKGDAKGVFQFESAGFRELLCKLRPDRFEDLIAAVAMYRPGPLGCGMVDTYINCKHGKEEAKYLHPLIEPILQETHGLILYQEQVQALALQLAHFTLSEGDLMRRAMGKKIAEIMAEYKDKFAKQAHDTCGSKIAEQVFEQIEYFAGYGFNKSHSACYAMVAYQTAYMKCHYPREYMAALLTINGGDSKKVVEYIDDAKHLGIEVLPPDINESDSNFTVVGPNIRFGLAAIKGVGEKAVDCMVVEREENGPFKSLYDFCERVDLRALNKGTIEAMIKAGAFESMGGHRAQYVAGLEGALSAGNASQKAASIGQFSLFGGGGAEEEPTQLPEVPEWPDQQLLQFEKEVLGFYVTSHPLAQYKDQIDAFSSSSVSRLSTLEDQTQVTIGGMIVDIKLGTDKRDKRYARLTFEDIDGAVSAMCFSRTYEEVKEFLEVDRIVFIRGKVDRRRDEPNLIVDEIIPLEKAAETLTKLAIINLDAAGLEDERVGGMMDLLKAHKGDVPLYFRVRTHNRRLVTIRAGRGFSVRPTTHLANDISRFLGEGHLRYSARTAM